LENENPFKVVKTARLKRIPGRITLNGSPIRPGELLMDAAEAKTIREFGIRGMITRLNRGRDFGWETTDEWMRYLRLLLSGRAKALMNPYADLANFTIEPLSRAMKHLNETPLVRQLPPFSDAERWGSRVEPAGVASRTLLILAVGGADTTFYGGMPQEEIEEFVTAFIPRGLLECLEPSDVRKGIPRAFASKALRDGQTVTLVESLMGQAYAAGFRHVAVLSNPTLAPAITAYLKRRFPDSARFKWTVTVQPLLPVIAECPETGDWNISEETAGYPGGHGHGFKHTLMDSTVRKWIAVDGLENFLFSNGDNAALFSRGAGHFEETLARMRTLKGEGTAPGLRTGFYLVWERFRKGGFAFFLRNKVTGEVLPQIVEAELALESGVDMDPLIRSTGGYNTNVAVGFLSDAYGHLERLPLNLKRKNLSGCVHWMFEASFATAMTTVQDERGGSHLDCGSSMVVLAPDDAVHPHWIHISLRNRSEWLAYQSSLFSPRTVRADGMEFASVQSDRDSSIPLPKLEGDLLGIGSKEFFDIFRSASIDLNSFSGTLRIDFTEADSAPRGKIRFEGEIRFTGIGSVTFRIPPGESWIIRNATIHSPSEITRSDQIPV
jgi:hypothetical protein